MGESVLELSVCVARGVAFGCAYLILVYLIAGVPS